MPHIMPHAELRYDEVQEIPKTFIAKTSRQVIITYSSKDCYDRGEFHRQDQKGTMERTEKTFQAAEAWTPKQLEAFGEMWEDVI